MLHTNFISLDASVTNTENKTAELITENENLETIKNISWRKWKSQRIYKFENGWFSCGVYIYGRDK